SGLFSCHGGEIVPCSRHDAKSAARSHLRFARRRRTHVGGSDRCRRRHRDLAIECSAPPGRACHHRRLGVLGGHARVCPGNAPGDFEPASTETGVSLICHSLEGLLIPYDQLQVDARSPREALNSYLERLISGFLMPAVPDEAATVALETV